MYQSSTGERLSGIAAIHADPLALQNEWHKSRYDPVFRVADGDPARLRFLLRSTVEESHDYMAAFIRRKQFDADQQQQQLNAAEANRGKIRT